MIGEWLAAGRCLPVEPAAVTVAEIVNAYHRHAKLYYRRADGTPTGEASRIARELLAAGWARASINHAVGTTRDHFSANC